MCSMDSGEGLAFEGKAWAGLLTGAPPGPHTREPMSCAQHRRGVGAADCLTWVTQTLYPDRTGCLPGWGPPRVSALTSRAAGESVLCGMGVG